MKQLISILIAITAIALQAKEFDIDFQFSPTFRLAGRMHDHLMILNHAGRRIVCRTGRATVHDRNWLAEHPKDSSDALYTESAPMDGVGKVIMLMREECLLGGETCVRGIAYLVKNDGKWEKGVFAKRTLGWGKTESEIWEGYEFAQQCPDCGKAIGKGEYLKHWEIIRRRKWTRHHIRNAATNA